MRALRGPHLCLNKFVSPRGSAEQRGKQGGRTSTYSTGPVRDTSDHQLGEGSGRART